MLFNEKRPDWFYSFLEIPNLEQIQNEMRAINLKKKITQNRAFNSYYVNMFRQDLDEKDYPATIEWMKSAGIYEKFLRILLTQEKTTAPHIHIDSVDPEYCNCSINIPLDYCEGTYTAFYKTKQPEAITPCFPDKGALQSRNFAWLPVEQAEEVARVETIKPVLVNTTVLHRAISEEPKRTLCCFRFSPELTYEEVKRLGIKNPFVQMDK
jgi:hypothetical protein